jgi:hypothetical protein
MRGSSKDEMGSPSGVVKRIVCLANSRKLNGRCIAGIELRDPDGRSWIRPVSSREHEEVSEYERQYQDGSDPQVLDIIEVPLIAPKPSPHQPENWLLDPDLYWDRVDRLPPAQLDQLVDSPWTLWLNGNHTYNGQNDQIPIEQASETVSSLKLIRVDGLQLKVFAPGEAFGNTKRRVQARFKWGGDPYWLWVTDPLVERSYLARADGEYAIGRRFLTVSLGEPFNGFCYKLVAAVIRADGELPAA